LTSDQREAYPVIAPLLAGDISRACSARAPVVEEILRPFQALRFFYDFPFRDVGGKSSLSCVDRDLVAVAQESDQPAVGGLGTHMTHEHPVAASRKPAVRFEHSVFLEHCNRVPGCLGRRLREMDFRNFLLV
jgi:hypothetical protein